MLSLCNVNEFPRFSTYKISITLQKKYVSTELPLSGAKVEKIISNEPFVERIFIIEKAANNRRKIYLSGNNKAPT